MTIKFNEIIVEQPPTDIDKLERLKMKDRSQYRIELNKYHRWLEEQRG